MMLVLGIVAYAFHAMGMDLRRDVNTAHQGERALSLAQSAIDEAFDDVQKRVNIPPPPGTKDDRSLYTLIRTATTSQVIDLSFDPVNTRKTADLSFDVAPVQLAIGRFQEGAGVAQTADVSKMPADLKARIKAGWEEYFKTGICGPDMDLVFTPPETSGGAAGFIAARSSVTASGAASGVSRTLEVRRAFSDMKYPSKTTDVLTALGVPQQIQQRGIQQGFLLDPSAGGAEKSASAGDVHVAPYEDLRLVDRRKESGW